MIKVNIRTNIATREPIPANLVGLDEFTLQNLQTELNPVPDDLIDIEYWLENNLITPFDADAQKLGAEILTPDIPNKIVNITHSIVALTPQELADNLSNAKANKQEDLAVKAESVNNEGVTVNGLDIDSDHKTIGDITSSLSLIGRNPTEEINFKANNGWGIANKATLEAMQDVLWTHRKSTNANHKLHYDVIEALTTPSSVETYDFSGGW